MANIMKTTRRMNHLLNRGEGKSVMRAVHVMDNCLLEEEFWQVGKKLGLGGIFHLQRKGKKISGRQNTQVRLKDGEGLVFGKGILLSEVQTGDDVVGLILFPHQVAVCIEEMYGSGHQKENGRWPIIDGLHWTDSVMV